MKTDRAGCALLALQWVLGLVILAEAAAFAFSPGSAHTFAKTGLPDFIRLALAWGEMVAAILFLIPRMIVAGGWLLIAMLAAAVVLHLLHGWWNVGPLLVYAAATWAVMAGRARVSAGNWMETK
jgi:hypothetical protein